MSARSLRLRLYLVMTALRAEWMALAVPPRGGSTLYVLQSPKSTREASAEYFAMRERAGRRCDTLAKRIARVQAMADRAGGGKP